MRYLVLIICILGTSVVLGLAHPVQSAPVTPNMTDWSQYSADDANGFILGTSEEVAQAQSANASLQSIELAGILVESTVSGLVTLETQGDWRTIADEVLSAFPHAEPNWAMQAGPMEPLVVPNDPYYSQQWAASDMGVNLTGWDRSPAKSVIDVMVIDTGCGRHPDLVFASCDKATRYGSAEDGNGHGTFVAGIIAATSNNGAGIASFNHGYIRIKGCKALSDEGSGYVSDVIECIRIAEQKGVKLINMSLGAPGEVTIYRDELNRLHDKGVISICAAGNGGVSEPRTSPAQYCSLSVGAYDVQQKEADFSNRNSNIMGPGVSIVGAWKDGQYVSASGTSAAAPHIAGIAALVWAYSPDFPRGEVLRRLQDSKWRQASNGTPAPDLTGSLDWEPPRVIAQTPSPSRRGAAPTVITFEFNEATNVATCGCVKLIDTSGREVQATFSYDGGRKVSITPLSPLRAPSTYTVSIGHGIQDLARNVYSPTRWSFGIAGKYTVYAGVVYR